ncbi:MAG TPA: YciI-like protein [Thermomicrobiales bacterium]|nr:YciI-like protein [Thermomicrobiales bacterium]
MIVVSAARPATGLTAHRELLQAEVQMPYFALFYDDLVEDYVERRAAVREDHLRGVWAAHERGELLLAGALADPVDRALLIFRAPDRAAVEAFARADPYVTTGLVGRWEVRPWMVVIGDEPAAAGEGGRP